MSATIPIEAFRQSFAIVFEEIFEQVHGYLLDKGTSMFETLESVSAEEASRPISANCACLAAQVNHVRFYIDVLNEGARTGTQIKADWDGSWLVGPVDEVEWQRLIDRLRAAYDETCEFVKRFDGWDERFLGGALALLAHCAYHLGEIRQGLGVLRG
jgi:hypothetical protein